jgi:uncharacterized protein YlxW (UPF0749 family)
VINNPFQMVVLIVLIVMLASVLRARYSRPSNEVRLTDDPEARRLLEEMKQLKERLATLERITIEKENSLERQIEELRDS